MIKILAAMAAALTLAGCATAVRPSDVLVQTGDLKPLTSMVGSTVVATVTNNGKRPVKRFAVSCRFFDGAGVVVNTASIFFNNLAVGATDTNGAIVPMPGVARAVCGEATPAKRAAR